MKRVYIITGVTCAVILGIFLCFFRLLNLSGAKEHLTVGFIYDNDESTPYTYNFSLAKDAVEKTYGERKPAATYWMMRWRNPSESWQERAVTSFSLTATVSW